MMNAGVLLAEALVAVGVLWAQQFVELENRQENEVVADTSPVTLKPW